MTRALSFLLIACLLLPATASNFINSKIYKDYLKTPEKYRVPLADLKQAYNAQESIKKSPCKFGGTIKQCLASRTTTNAVEDGGWASYPNEKTGDLTVEYSIFVGARQTIFRWRISNSGSVKPINGHAINITK